MMFAQTIRALFEWGTVGGQTDRELLDCFAAGKDDSSEAAFAALVVRHGPMVLCVCRGVLGEEHDTEDAFQATFLVLAKRARSIRDPDLLGNWLYGTARRTAQKAKARRARWARRFQSEASMSRIVDDTAAAERGPIQREEIAAIHEEVDRLPRRLRVPIVLCYLQGLTHAEAARRLRWPIGTVRSRMARARGVLRNRLSRRGLAYAAVAIASETSRPAMADVPHMLTLQTTRAAVQIATGAASGFVSAPIAALVSDMQRATFVSGLMRSVAALLAAACVFAGAEMLAVRASQVQPSNKQSDGTGVRVSQRTGHDHGESEPTRAAKTGRKMTISGVVMDPDGKPVAGAAVAAVGFPRRPKFGGDYTSGEIVFGPTTADRTGRFRLDVQHAVPSGFFNVDVIAGAESFGMGWRPLDPDAESSDIEIRLRPEQVVRGRLVDLRGEPATGITVTVGYLTDRTAEGGVGMREHAEDLAPWPARVKTGDRGEFLIKGVGRGVGMAIMIRDDRFARQEIRIEPPAAAEPEGKVYVLTPAHPIDGQVTYADTGAPVPGARMAVQGGHYANGQADALGRFRLNPYADVPYKSMTTGESLFSVFAYAPEGQPYLGVQKEITWKKGSVRQTVEFALPRGVLVRGKVTEAGSGRPVAGCQILYAPLNPPTFDESYSVLTGEWSTVVSREDGSYSIPVPEGPGHLVATKAAPEYVLSEYGSQVLAGNAGGLRKYAQAIVRIEAVTGSDPVEFAISLRRGVTLTGRVIGPDGQPVVDGAIITRFNVSAQASRWGGYPVPVRDGRFALSGLEPDGAYSLLVHDAKQRWGAAIDVTGKASANEPMMIRLARCGQVKIRLVDSAGKPIAGYKAALQLVLTPGRFQCDFDGTVRGDDLAADAGPGLGYSSYSGGPATDSDGRATFSGLIPGATYRLLTTERDNISIDSKVLKDFRVTAGQTVELPAITIERN